MKTLHGGLLVVCILLKLVEAVPLASFYTFGSSAGDTTLHRNDDSYSSRISLSTAFPYFGTNHRAVYVNNNGVVSFDAPVSTFTPEAFPINGSRVLLSPYWGDVDTRSSNGGFVYYRQSTDSILLTKARNQVRTLFPAFSSFTPTFLFIATWDHVGYFTHHTDKNNTFQCVMITNGINAFVAFLYADGLIQWTTGDASGGSNGTGGTPAQGGFNAGDGVRYFSIPGSQTAAIVNIETRSNVGVPGLWMFRVDQNSIATPSAPPTSNINECVLGTHDCSPNADCIDTMQSYTCVCRTGFTGDGRTCTALSGPPTDVVATALSATTVSVSWQPPALLDQNGVIIAYQVVLVDTMDGSRKVSSVSGDTLTLLFEGLNEYTTYNVSVATNNSFGIGPYSQPVQVKTQESIPGHPTNLTGNVQDKTSVQLRWSKPNDPNGIILGYQVFYYGYKGNHTKNDQPVEIIDEERSLTVGPNTTSVVINNLELGLSYDFKVRARTSIGYGANSSAVTVTLDVEGGTGTATGGMSGAITAIIVVAIIGWVLLVVLVVIVVAAVIYRRRRKHGKYDIEGTKKSNDIDMVTTNPEAIESEKELEADLGSSTGKPALKFDELSDEESIAKTPL